MLNRLLDFFPSFKKRPKKNEIQLSLLLSLPNEILLSILQFIPLKDLLKNVPQTCKQLNALANDDRLFKNFPSGNRAPMKFFLENEKIIADKDHYNRVILYGPNKADFAKMCQQHKNRWGFLPTIIGSDIYLLNPDYSSYRICDGIGKEAFRNYFQDEKVALLFPQESIKDAEALYQKIQKTYHIPLGIIFIFITKNEDLALSLRNKNYNALKFDFTSAKNLNAIFREIKTICNKKTDRSILSKTPYQLEEMHQNRSTKK